MGKPIYETRSLTAEEWAERRIELIDTCGLVQLVLSTRGYSVVDHARKHWGRHYATEGQARPEFEATAARETAPGLIVGGCLTGDALPSVASVECTP